MKPVSVQFFRLLILLGLSGACIVGCNKQETVTPQQTAQAAKTAVDNNQIVGITKEVLDLTQDGLVSEGLIEATSASTNQSARRSGGCRPVITGTYTLTIHTIDTLSYHGQLTIDYGDGTTCGDSVNVHKGKITDLFTITIVNPKKKGTKPVVSQLETITFENFQKDSAVVNGTFIKQLSGGVTTVTAQNATITYLDGTSVSWSGTLTYAHNDNGTAQIWSDDTQTITGSLSGITREGVAYIATITKDITYSVSCLKEAIDGPVSGILSITTNGATAIIDYGNGSCDNVYTISGNGITTEYTFQ